MMHLAATTLTLSHVEGSYVLHGCPQRPVAAAATPSAVWARGSVGGGRKRSLCLACPRLMNEGPPRVMGTSWGSVKGLQVSLSPPKFSAAYSKLAKLPTNTLHWERRPLHLNYFHYLLHLAVGRW